MRPGATSFVPATNSLRTLREAAARCRGGPLDSDLAPCVIATIHPAAILRAPDADRQTERERFAHDLEGVAARLGTGTKSV